MQTHKLILAFAMIGLSVPNIFGEEAPNMFDESEQKNVFNVQSGDWNNPSSWSLNHAPGEVATGDASTVIYAGREATTSADTIPTVNHINLVIWNSDPSETQSTLNVRHNLSTEFGNKKGRVFIGSHEGSYGTLNQTGGTLTTGNIEVGAADGKAPFKSHYNLTGGSINAWWISLNNNAIFSIHGSSPTVAANAMTLWASGEVSPVLEFRLGPNGAKAVALADSFTVGNTAKLSIDASAYTGGPASIELVKFGSKSGEFVPANITISGLGKGLTASIGYTPKSMILNVKAGSESSAKK